MEDNIEGGQDRATVRTDRLLQSVEGLVSESRLLRDDISSISERNRQDRKMLKILTGIVAAKLVTLVLLVIVIVQLISGNHVLADCINSNGTCAKKNAAASSVIVDLVGYKSEARRLSTEIYVAKGKGDDLSVRLRQQRLTEINHDLSLLNENLQDIQAGRQPHNQVPNDLDSP